MTALRLASGRELPMAIRTCLCYQYASRIICLLELPWLYTTCQQWLPALTTGARMLSYHAERHKAPILSKKADVLASAYAERTADSGKLFN